ncbi:MAG TPA: lantibiotic dehydratase C-terminal domain-containing protein [Candidatus Kapabacteria bacterium]|nr:lantibiotic dehydratase C-terminal domain-containing protein [Candidatus Kapabacteria bacterium]
MMNNKSKTWLAAYLYHAEPWEDFLVNVMKPFVDNILEKAWAEQFFFIRFWERGPHIRLRFKGENDILQNQVKSRLETYFLNYFKEHPSLRREPEDMAKWQADQQWFPNDSVQYIEYGPEVERYGGPEAILIAEKQFETSSRDVLAVIADSASWDYDRALGAAIQLHLGFVFALGMNLAEAGEFFSRIARHWFASAYGYIPNAPNISPEELKKSREITMKAFEENFSRQKATLVSYHETMWNAFTAGREFEQEWLNFWVQRMKAIADELKNMQKQNKLLIPPWFQPEPGKKTPVDCQYGWPILESYIHMTNNRLGILNRDEAYLGYLIKESLKAVELRSTNGR